jgi:hypothetical protein
VGQKYIIHSHGKHGSETIEKVKTPPNLSAFVRMFDSGQFAELIQVPPRCDPHRSKLNPKRKHGPSGTPIKRQPPIKRLHLARDVQRFKAQK